MDHPLSRRTTAEAIGTGFLVAAVVGSGIAAERLSPGKPGLQLLVSSIATVLVLAALIFTFGSVSGAHLNPAVTLASWPEDGSHGVRCCPTWVHRSPADASERCSPT